MPVHETVSRTPQPRSRRALAQLITQAERGVPLGHRWSAPHDDDGWVVGITGPPGAGKSTLVDRLITELRADGARVAVLAVDPSSRLSGGALLGDRVRMGSHSFDDGVYIRSVGSRGSTGGLSPAIDRSVEILRGAGFDWVLVETVGVGQIESDVMLLADTTVVVLMPGSGDIVQANKAGLLEIADIFVVNKADLPTAGTLVYDLHDASTGRKEGAPPIIQTTAISGVGVSELADALRAGRADCAGAVTRAARRQERRRVRLIERTLESLRSALEEYATSDTGRTALDRLSERPEATGAELLQILVADVLGRPERG
jgi:LAO/AO transport system kinase